MLVADFIDNAEGNFPEEFYMSLPVECPDCGFPLGMSDVLTGLHCTNVRCPAKLAKRLTAMASALGVKGVGDSVARQIVDFLKSAYNTTNIMIIFSWEPAVDGCPEGCSIDSMNKIAQQFKDKRKMTLSEYIRIANIPNVQTSAVQLFEDSDDINEVYKLIGSDTSYIEQKLGITSGENDAISIRATKIFQSLMAFKDELIQGVQCVDIIPVHSGDLKSFTAVCSDEVGAPFKTKADFYNKVNEMFEGKIHVEFLGSVKKSIDYLVWAGADGSPARHTSKVKKVEGYNIQYAEHKASGSLKDGEHYIPILTASQFIETLKGVL